VTNLITERDAINSLEMGILDHAVILKNQYAGGSYKQLMRHLPKGRLQKRRAMDRRNDILLSAVYDESADISALEEEHSVKMAWAVRDNREMATKIRILNRLRSGNWRAFPEVADLVYARKKSLQHAADEMERARKLKAEQLAKEQAESSEPI